MYRGRCVVSSPLAPGAARDDLIARRDRQIKYKDAKSQMFEDAAGPHAPLHTPSPLAPRAARDDLIARRDRQIKSKDAKSQMFEDAADLQAQLHTLPVHVPP